jgi:hypothetical protein
LTFMPISLAQGFAWRLSFYIILDFLILWHYKDRMKVIWKSIWENVNTKFKFPVWSYLLLPIFAITLEVVGVIPKILTELILHPSETIDSLMKIPELIGEILRKISG